MSTPHTAFTDLNLYWMFTSP